MTIAERLTDDMKSSMRAGDTRTTGVLRLLRAAMKNEEIKLGHELSEDEAMKILQREAKQRRDSIEQYNAGGRPELAAGEEAELVIVNAYLPQPMSQDDLAKVVDEVIAAQGATSPAQMGTVIGGVMSRVGAAAEGGAVSKIVRERLGA